MLENFSLLTKLPESYSANYFYSKAQLRTKFPSLSFQKYKEQNEITRKGLTPMTSYPFK